MALDTKEYNRRYYQKHKEIINARSKKYREENRERFNETRRKYYAENKERIRECQKRYNNANRKKVTKIQVEYRKRKAEELKAQGQMYCYLPKTERETKMIEKLSKKLRITKTESKMMLEAYNWNIKGILSEEIKI